MRVCHVLGSYFQGKSFTKIQERVIIVGRNYIVYVDLVWTVKKTFRK